MNKNLEYVRTLAENNGVIQVRDILSGDIVFMRHASGAMAKYTVKNIENNDGLYTISFDCGKVGVYGTHQNMRLHALAQ